MRTVRIEGGWLARLERGEELIAGLRSLMRAEEIGCGAVVGLGATQAATLGFYDLERRDYDRRELDGFYEICGLTGSLSWHDGEPFPHVHLVLAGPDFRAVAGHCFRAEASATIELWVRAAGTRVERRPDESVGLHLMQLPETCPILPEETG